MPGERMACFKKMSLLCFFIAVAIIAVVEPNPCDFVDDPPPPPVSRTSSDLDDSFYLLRVLRRSYPRLQFRPSTVSVIPFAGDKSCVNRKQSSRKSKGKTSKMAADNKYDQLQSVFTNSTCKSYLVLNHDPNRTPATVVEVRCACRHCQTASGPSSNDCKPIYNYRRMMRRQCDARKRTYVDVEVLERLIVGCTCVNRTIKTKSTLHSTPN